MKNQEVSNSAITRSEFFYKKIVVFINKNFGSYVLIIPISNIINIFYFFIKYKNDGPLAAATCWCRKCSPRHLAAQLLSKWTWKKNSVNLRPKCLRRRQDHGKVLILVKMANMQIIDTIFRIKILLCTLFENKNIW